jgi:hypothetical protein
MTQKDYKVLAAALRSVRPHSGAAPDTQHAAKFVMWQQVVDALCNKLKENNSAFSPGIFREACHQ